MIGGFVFEIKRGVWGFSTRKKKERWGRGSLTPEKRGSRGQISKGGGSPSPSYFFDGITLMRITRPVSKKDCSLVSVGKQLCRIIGTKLPQIRGQMYNKKVQQMKCTWFLSGRHL